MRNDVKFEVVISAQKVRQLVAEYISQKAKSLGVLSVDPQNLEVLYENVGGKYDDQEMVFDGMKISIELED